MKALDFFDRIYVVHLPNKERREAMDAQLEALGLKRAVYLHAAAPPANFELKNMRRAPAEEFGANLSHIRAVVQAIADRAERPLFIEDDVVFDTDANDRLAAALGELPSAWDVFYLGGHPRSPATLVTPQLAVVGTFSFAEAYSVRGQSLPGLFAYWANRISQPCAMWDFILGEYAARHFGFAVYPVVTRQAPNFSQIGHKFDDKTGLVERGWANNLSSR